MSEQPAGNPYTTADWRGDVAVIGGGIVGLATAREILRRRPGTRLIVLEREERLAAHQTGHNSGVIHSGVYYAPGSLKAKACVAGAAQLKAYCDEKGIPWDPCGKVIVATDESELPRLEEIHRRGMANGVPGIRMIGADELREVEPHVVGIRALLSPATGIVDYVRVAEAYAEDIREYGGEVRTRHGVTNIRRKGGATRLTTAGGEIEARWVIACAGAWSDRVAEMTGAARTPRIVPFRGDYYILRPERRSLVRGNIYPVPDPRFPFLGVHFTPRMNGDLWLGPNAVLAFARDGYRFRDVRLGDLFDMFSYGGFLRFGRKHWRTGYDEMARDLSKKRFLASLQKYIPELTLDDLLPGPSGVRAQALGPDGALVDDFVIDRGDGVLHIRNAPSPAATSSLQIGAMVADAFEEMAR
ncbi:MAG: L-2-hydroxyglutarate oxidase [Chloroflexi bacterium]|nr:MAG: L-2-hydroxyglutarate oxidase [Chloroflexota bacterium]